MRRHVVRWVAVALGLGLLVGGITAATADQSPDSSAPAAGADFGPDGPGPSDSPDPALSGQPVPTLPPGDPGTDEPGTDDPQDPADDSDEPDRPDGDSNDGADGARLTEVPAAALLDAETVGTVAGGSWVPTDLGSSGADDSCGTGGQGGAPTRAALLVADDGAGRLVQSVATWPTARDARAAVSGLGSALAACGFAAVGDPRLGEASAAFDRTVDGSPQHAVVIAVEGATLVLAGSGTAAAPGTWESLTDVAMGSVCAAGVHGCH